VHAQRGRGARRLGPVGECGERGAGLLDLDEQLEQEAALRRRRRRAGLALGLGLRGRRGEGGGGRGGSGCGRGGKRQPAREQPVARRDEGERVLGYLLRVRVRVKGEG
jgi:hypothetical protein